MSRRYERFAWDKSWFYSDLDLEGEAEVLDNCDCSISDYVKFKEEGMEVLCIGYHTNQWRANTFVLLRQSQSAGSQLLLVEYGRDWPAVAPPPRYDQWNIRAVSRWELIERMDTFLYGLKYSDDDGFGVLYEIKHFLEKLGESSAVPTGRKIHA